MEESFAEFLRPRWGHLLYLTGEHVMLVGVSTGLAVAAAVPLGILAFRRGWARLPVLGTSGILQTFPSLAMLALLQILYGRIGKVPAVTALALYALFPVVQNTVVGLRGVPDPVDQAGRGLGMTESQRLWMVRFPLALPVILAGVRTAAVIAVGIATLSALIGAGGLGDFIIRGLRLNDWRLQVLGGVPAILLALLVYGAVSAGEWACTREARRAARRPALRALRWGAALFPLFLLGGGLAVYAAGPSGPGAASGSAPAAGKVRVGEPGTIRLGSKAFGEQYLLCEMMALLLEDGTRLRVERRLGLGGTKVCHDALVGGSIDLYPEYTGTGMKVILQGETWKDPFEAYKFVAAAYRDRFGAEWLPPFGFSNAYAITVRRKDAEARGWTRVSDLAGGAGELRAGFTAEFNERRDGYPGLREAYGLEFGSVVDMAPTLMYRAARDGQVDVICAYTTDGRIRAYDLKVLEDDRRFFPPYQCAPVVRGAFLAAHPEVRTVLAPLAGRLDDATMRRLNLEIDEDKRDPGAVARAYLAGEGLLGSGKE